MPKGDYYKDLRLATAVRKMADHHHATKNRHISEGEYVLLLRAAEALNDDRSS